jgi:hypothetical protein
MTAEKPWVLREREKAKLAKERKRKREKYEKLKAALAAKFKLPPHQPRPDAIPFGTAMNLLRGWGAKHEIFVSDSNEQNTQTKVFAMIRAVPNDHNPRAIRGVVPLPHPVVAAEVDEKKLAVIMEEGEDTEPAKNAGMIVGGHEYLQQVC